MSGGWWLLLALGAGVAAAWAVCRWPAVDRRLESPSPAESEDAARYVAAAPAPSRTEQAEAVRALLCASPTYAYVRLATYEAELSGFAELLLELDDLTPLPDEGESRH